MIRIIHVINSFAQGGSETQLLGILRDYDRTCFHVDACTVGADPGPLAYQAESMGAEVFSCPKSPNLVSFSRRFANLLAGRRYDVVHAHFDAWSGPICRGAAQAGVPVRIAHLRSVGAQGMGATSWNPAVIVVREVVRGWGRRWISRYATNILGVSKAALDRRWPGWQNTPSRFMVWTAGVDAQYFCPGNQGMGTANPPTVICVSNYFLRSKRQDLALRIFSEVLKSVPQARMVLVGHGTYETGCKRMADALGVRGSVDFMGLRDRESVLQLLRSSSVFLSCSESEGLPNVLLEAQAVGLPVVASDIPAHREVVALELLPYLFELDGVHAAADKVTNVLRDAELRAGLARAARMHVEVRYDGSRCLSALEEHYRNWTAQSRQCHASY